MDVSPRKGFPERRFPAAAMTSRTTESGMPRRRHESIASNSRGETTVARPIAFDHAASTALR
jgi:hypothetical protein